MAGRHVVLTLTLAAPLGAQAIHDLRTAPVRPLGAVGAVCTEIGQESRELPEGLLGVTSAVELPAGAIFLTNIGTGQILQFDGRGRYIGATMRRGQGPGELSTPRSVSSVTGILLYRYRGDSLVVFDAAYRRVTILDHTGKFARDFTLTGRAEVGPGAYLAGVSRPDGDLLFVQSMMTQMSPGPRSRIYRDSITVLRVGPRGDFVWSSPWLEGAERLLPAAAPSTGRGTAISYDPTAIPRPQRIRSVVAAGSTLVHYAESQNELVVYGRSGAVVGRVQLPTLPTPDYRGGQMPTSLLTYVDAANRVWLEIPRARLDSPRVWWVMTADGRLLGSVTSAPRQEPIHIGTEAMLLRLFDADGVPTVRRCTLPAMR